MIEVGVLLPTREAVVAGRDDPGPLLALSEAAEDLGFDSLWAGDSPVARPRLDPLALLSAVAARTRRVQLGTAVLLAALRPAVVLAHALASLDRIAGGRLIVGVGAGFPYPATQAEFAAAGVAFDQRIGRLMETVEVCRRLWSEERASFAGRHWSFDDVELRPRPQQPGGPALWLAGAGPRGLAHVGRRFDGWLPYSPTPEEFAAGLAAVRAAAAKEGRDPGAIVPALYATVALDDDPTRADAELARYTDGYYGLPLQGVRQLQAFHGGTASGCAEWLRGYLDAGARHLILRFGTLDDPAPMLERAAREVLPALRAEAPA